MERKLELKSEFAVYGDLIRRPWGACWMVAEGGEGENPLPYSPKMRGGVGGGG